jgi:hypothetical protein
MIILEKPNAESLLSVLAQIATARPDVITTPELRNILIDMGLPLEKVEAETSEPRKAKLQPTAGT